MDRRLRALLFTLVICAGLGTLTGHARSMPPASAAETRALWVSHGPRGGRALALEVSPAFRDDGVAFSGEWLTSFQSTESGIGIVRSTDGGRSWAISDGGTHNVNYASAVHDFAFSPVFTADQAVFAATWGGLFRSDDGGANWSWLEDAYGGPPGAYTTIAVSPSFEQSRQVLAGDWGGLLVSNDAGESWTRMDDVGAAADIAFSPAYDTDGVVLSSDGATLFRSQDRAQTWTPVLTGTVTSLAVSPDFARDQTLFGSGGAHLYVSNDGGSTWISRTVAAEANMLNALAISPDFADDGTLFAGANSGLYWSGDGGLTWEAIAAYAGTPVRSLAISPQWPQHTLLLVGTDAGVYRLLETDPPSAEVRQPTSGFAPLVASPLAWSAEANLLLTATRNHGVYGSYDRGQQWQPLGLQAASSYYSFSDVVISPGFGQDGTLFASWLSGTGIGGAVYRSSDGGAHWENVYGTDYVGDLALSPAYESDMTVFATSGDDGLVRSTNGGDDWEEVGIWPGGSAHGVAQYVALPPDYPANGTLFVGGSMGVWRLPAGETAWLPAATGITAQHTVIALAISPDFAADQTLLALAYWMASGNQQFGVFKSQDGGLNWQASGAGIIPGDLFDVTFSPHFAQDRTVYVTTLAGELYHSRDGAQSWTSLGTAPGAPALYDVIVTEDGQPIAGSQQGVWRYVAEPRQTFIPLIFGPGAPD